MADLIRLLPDSLANQIAAGEVVQRPSSVVKELLENAIDAGATRIVLTIKDGGKTWIQVSDNGSGMSDTDARMCFERHATSKLKEVGDLFNIRTMGFRGEAMASIAAVAQVELKTRLKENDLGTRILIENSRVLLQEPCQASSGTQIIVKNLFFNIPARKNFLKSDAREQSYIQEEFVRIAMCYPEVAFDFLVDDRPVMKLQPGNLKQRIASILAKDVSKNLIPLSEETDLIRIHGLVGTPDIAKKRRGDQYFFVNGRYIQSYFLNHAVVQAYEHILPEGTFPFYVIFIDIEPSQIDVNVHPTKQEIKFEDERILYNYLKVATRYALASYQIAPSLDFERMGSMHFGGQPSSFKAPAPVQEGFRPETQVASKPPTGALLQMYEELMKPDTEEGTHAVRIPSALSQENAELFGEKEISLPYQVHRKYIFCHLQTGILMVDQRAAHERILYERYLKAMQGQAMATQQELFPKILELTPTDTRLLLEIVPLIRQMGFDLQEFGTNTFVLHGTPAQLRENQDAEALFHSFIQQYKEQVSPELKAEEKAAAALAKATAIKPGVALHVEEMNALVDQLFGCAMPYRSPGGRKCFINLDLEELDQKFR
jgi:DNA mismatch repair protein MutL